MRHRIAEDAKPQLLLLLLATAITLVLWFIPFTDYIVYPIRLFVTFIHESSHALIAVLTGGSVQSLTISSDGSGVVYSAPSGMIGGLLTSSAGYLGSTAFGVLMLYLIPDPDHHPEDTRDSGRSRHVRCIRMHIGAD